MWGHGGERIEKRESDEEVSARLLSGCPGQSGAWSAVTSFTGDVTCVVMAFARTPTNRSAQIKPTSEPSPNKRPSGDDSSPSAEYITSAGQMKRFISTHSTQIRQLHKLIQTASKQGGKKPPTFLSSAQFMILCDLVRFILCT